MIWDDTVCSISTPQGNGAIAIIRLSGNEALPICKKIFRPHNPSRFKNPEGYTVHHGKIIENKKVIDEVLVIFFQKPNSYTGEDVIEISCHGSFYIQQKIMELLLANHACMAQPGEFTRRAFLNGKIDLSQAEAVADLIQSQTASAHNIALTQMRGGFSHEIAQLRAQLLEFVSLIELELDFSEEDVEFADRGQLKILLSEITEKAQKLKNSFQLGNVIKNGIPIVIIGEPNVGKSTLLNYFLNEDRAIVSPIPGTTRDTIEDTVNIQGFTFRFIDTAGLRESSDTIEIIGIKRAYKKLENASVVLLLVDAQKDFEQIEKQIQSVRKKIEQQKLIIVVNKIDKANPTTIELLNNLKLYDGEKLCFISAKEKTNLSDLTHLLLKNAKHRGIGEDDVIISNVRHFQALQKACLALQKSTEGLQQNLPSDLLTQDIRETIHYLGEITGAITTDEILGNIFARFCIGK